MIGARNTTGACGATSMHNTMDTRDAAGARGLIGAHGMMDTAWKVHAT